MSTFEIEAYDETQHHHRRQGRDPSASAPPAAGLSAWSACNRTSFRARSTSRRQFRAAGMPVVIGGFHVSGCISMLPELPADLQRGARSRHHASSPARPKAAWQSCCATSTPARSSRSTTTSHDLPDLAGGQRCRCLPRGHRRRIAGHYASFDAGRGCPFQCSFCTIINVQGRKSRYRTADDVEAHRARQRAPRASRVSSSPTTTSPATRTGKRSSTA